MSDISTNIFKQRMDELGLSFMAAGFDSFLSDQSRREDTLLEVLSDLVDLEYHPRKERMTRTQLLQCFSKPHVLLVDEVGYENLTPEQATLFFSLLILDMKMVQLFSHRIKTSDAGEKS